MINFPQYDSSISDLSLKSWIRCKRKAWLDNFGNQRKRKWSAHDALQANQEKRSLKAITEQTSNLKEGINSCSNGSLWVLGFKLEGLTPNGQRIEGTPLLLKKIKGESRWGNFSYIPVIVKKGKYITKEHRLLLAIYGYLLDELQGSKNLRGLIISQGVNQLEKQEIVINQKYLIQLFINLEKLSESLSLNKVPPLTKDRKKCNICAWKDYCKEEAKKDGDLNIVNGIGMKRKEDFISIGINNIAELAESSPEEINQKLDISDERNKRVAYQLVNQAKSQISGKVNRINLSKSIPEITSSTGVLIYDIESDPDEKLDFLHGFLRINRLNNNELDLANAIYEPIFTMSQNQEEVSWEQIKNKLIKFKDWPILHYGETEIVSLIRMAKYYKASRSYINIINRNLVDVHSRIRKNWLFPVESYGLKTVANSINFNWTQENAEGSKALLLWREWNDLDTREKSTSTKLKWILDYNKDDCLATFHVARWLLKYEQ